MNIPPQLPSKILIGISLDVGECKELLSWAVDVLARPGDTVVAMHVIGVMPKKKAMDGKKQDKINRQTARKQLKQIRQAKSFVISVVGELVKPCQSNDVNLEARVGLNTSAGRGLVEEAENMGADYLVIGGRKKRTNRSDSSHSFLNNMWKKLTRITFTLLSSRGTYPVSKYCYEHVPQGCSFFIVRRTQRSQQGLGSKSIRIQDLDQESSGKVSEKNSYTEASFSSEESEIIKCKKASPRTVLDICEAESNTDEEDTSNSGDSSSCSAATSLLPNEKQELVKKTNMSPLKMISSFFRQSCDWSMRKQNNALFDTQKQQSLLRSFSFSEISSATNNFHLENMVGKGGYSEVYKGDLADGCSIAVKRLAKDNSNANKEKEFLIELGIIGHVNHPNTAKLVGFCIENGLYLVFDFYPNGTLSSALHGQTSKSLDWPTRYRVVLGIAKGLHYLHKCCKHRIIHRDIKASNVLLGPDYEPQISDFGLAKWLPSKWTHHAVIPIEGTFGYLAPEYFMHGIVDEKTDVFAFGILLLEVITGRRPVDSARQNLLLWARPLMESGNLSELVDPKMEGGYDMDQLYKVVLTASYCVRQSSIWRPSMTEVLQLLTYGQDSETAPSRRIPKFTSDEMDDYSMIFGYELPSDLALEDI